MASSLNIALNYFDHPKTKRLRSLLGRGSDVLPIRLWVYCGNFHCEDGRLTGLTAQEIEAVIDWWGPKLECADALTKVQFMDLGADGIYSVHDWLEHAGHIAYYKEKAKEMRRAKFSLAKPLAKSLANGLDKSLANATNHTTSVQCITDQPLPAVPACEGGIPKDFNGVTAAVVWAAGQRVIQERGWDEKAAQELIQKAEQKLLSHTKTIPTLNWMTEFVAIALTAARDKLTGKCHDAIAWTLHWVKLAAEGHGAPYKADAKLRTTARAELEKVWPK